MSLTEPSTSMADVAAPRMDHHVTAQHEVNKLSDNPEGLRTFVLSTAKNGHVTQCIAVANLIGVEIDDVFQIPGLNKALHKRLRDFGKLRYLPAAIRMVWKSRKGKVLFVASGRSVLSACRLLKCVYGNKVCILYVGSPKTWTTKCADVMLRRHYDREPGRDEDNLYSWQPKQVWVNSPICRPLPVSDSAQQGVTVLVGGVNATYGDKVADYSVFLDQIDTLVQAHPVSIVFSRRTRASVKTAIEQRFNLTTATLVDASDRQGFLTACENAGAFVVTPDSVTMVAEACATGKPVYMADLPIKNSETKNYRFIGTNLENGYVHPFDGVVNFECRPFDRADVEAARRDLTAHIEAWLRNPSVLST